MPDRQHWATAAQNKVLISEKVIKKAYVLLPIRQCVYISTAGVWPVGLCVVAQQGFCAKLLLKCFAYNGSWLAEILYMEKSFTLWTKMTTSFYFNLSL